MVSLTVRVLDRFENGVIGTLLLLELVVEADFLVCFLVIHFIVMQGGF